MLRTIILSGKCTRLAENLRSLCIYRHTTFAQLPYIMRIIVERVFAAHVSAEQRQRLRVLRAIALANNPLSLFVNCACLFSVSLSLLLYYVCIVHLIQIDRAVAEHIAHMCCSYSIIYIYIADTHDARAASARSLHMYM